MSASLAKMLQEEIKMSPFDRLVKIMTNPAVVLIYFALIIVSFLQFDKSLATYFFNANLEFRFPFLVWLTNLGLGGIYYPSFLGLALFFRYIRKDPTWEARFWFLFVCLAIPALITLILKMNLGRARPTLFLQNIEPLFGFYGFKMKSSFWSFPSGHTTTIMSVAYGLCIVFPRYFWGFILAGLAVAFSRVLLYNHYLSDVLFSIYLILIEIACILYVLRKKSWLAPAWKDRVE